MSHGSKRQKLHQMLQQMILWSHFHWMTTLNLHLLASPKLLFCSKLFDCTYFAGNGNAPTENWFYDLHTRNSHMYSCCYPGKRTTTCALKSTIALMWSRNQNYLYSLSVKWYNIVFIFWFMFLPFLLSYWLMFQQCNF